jgi:WD40 repeat protein/tRNA A-37 threonylcarbamoyl transferase component Bud32
VPDSTRFGRYEVEEEVARGGMGVIYRVRDPQMRRFLAMKVLLSEVGDGKAESGARHSNLSARFTDEAQLTGQLDHPGIIPVYDMGQDEEGRLFFTMRLVKGRTLEEVFDLVRDGQPGWTVTRALGVLQKVCEAMAFAHDRGVIHRDLKPANVMVGRFGETYVMDWGLAKLVDEEETPGSVEHAALQTVLSSARKDESSGGGELETLDGDVMGTPAYMAPEQARGQVQRVGPGSDVYALGAMLYHLLTGHAPYRLAGEGAPGREVLERLLAGPPSPLEREAAGVPPELCAICERAMAREPEARYAGMLEVAEDLQAYVENRVVRAYRRGAVVEFKKWVQRNRATAASLAAVFALVIAGLVSVSYVQTRAREEVEDRNRLLAAANVELEAERERTAEARDRAERNKERALESEKVALANEEEALWQSYVGNIGAAYAALEVGGASEARRRLAVCPESLRGWEWRYLDQRSEGSLRVLTGSETFVGVLDVSPVGSFVAAAGGMQGNSGAPDYAVRIWNFESGQLENELEGHQGTVASLAYSPAGDALASCDVRGHLRVWDVASGEVIAETSGMGSRIAYHPDGRLIATAAHGGGGVNLWDSYDLEVVATRNLAGMLVNAVRFSPDGQSLALACTDHHIRILDLDLEPVLELDASGEALESDRGLSIPGGAGPGVYAIDFAPDGRRLVSGSGDGFVRIFDLATGARLSFLRGHRSTVRAVRWHPRFSWIVSSDESGSIRFWEADTGRPLDVLRGHDEHVYALGFSALGDRLLSASRDATVRVWDGQAGANDTVLDGYAYPNFAPYWLAFSPDSERIAWRSGLNAYTVTDVRTGEEQCSLWTPDGFSTTALHFSEGGVWECGATGRLARWDAETGEASTALETGWIPTACAFGPGARTALVGGSSVESATPRTYGLKQVDLTSGAVRWTASLAGVPTKVCPSPDGTRCLVVTSVRGEGVGLACLETSSGSQLWQRMEHTGIHGLEFFPDGERFAHTTFNAWDDSLFIRSALTGELLNTFIGHAQPARLDISADGARIVTGNWDGTISLWSPERGEILAVPAHTDNVARVGFSPDGQTIASLGADGRRRLWSATPVESRQVARREAARRRRWSVDARRRVDELLLTRVHRAAVVEALEADTSLQPEQRAAAIGLARSEPISMEGLVGRSLAISLNPGRTGAEYMAAMDGAARVLDLAPNLAGTPTETLAELAPRYAVTHAAVAAAQIRLGLLREALANLERAEQVLSTGVSWPMPYILFLKSMARHHLGESGAAARDYESGLRELRMGNPAWLPGTAAFSRALELELRELLGRD